MLLRSHCAPRRCSARPAYEPIVLAAAIVLGILAGSPKASCGATFPWDGGGILPPFNNNNWLNLLNWDGNVPPPNNGTADIVIPDTPRDNGIVDVAWSINDLTFQGPANLSLSDEQLTIA